MGQADNQSVATPEPRVELPIVPQVAVSGAAQVYRSWRSPSDANLWAEQRLPHLSLEQIQPEFDALEVTHGKKAPAWVARVQELKQV
ncbi:MAG: hypothetical protein N4J56_004094 [Chroococcidiopsis sp. SAG 2025]|uniref:hypothetical protein n=1 Tax=Chroococcidiopsis sp. SAG 2025 TaxID=171389 RepID=UPI0029373073|nr:hypothetical protein [Chroococcidiopsis sp. SAG 2025]MDV2994440.1 hypothetical protein [Chroococcidiopsis sp. SAG 2025]